MRILNVLLALLVSILIAFGIFEGGLRLTSFAPTTTANHFDPSLGWSKEPGTSVRRKSAEFDIRLDINELGLRDDPMSSAAKPDGTYRVAMLGDSFTLGYTVARDGLFVDLLEDWWQLEGRTVDVINAGTEGYSTDQEVRWLVDHGEEFAPDLVMLFPYENDVFWNGQTSYLRYPKPRYSPNGSPSELELVDPGPRNWTEDWAITKALNALSGMIKGPTEGAMYFTPKGGTKPILREFAVLLNEQPEFMNNAIARTRGSLVALKATCAELGAELVIAPIPSKASVDPDARDRIGTGTLGLAPDTWNADAPVDLFVSLAGELGIKTLDPRSTFKAHIESGTNLYYNIDWHLNNDGNRAFARFLHDELDKPAMEVGIGKLSAPTKVDSPPRPVSSGIPTWAYVYLSLFVILSITYKMHYKEEAFPRILVQIGAMLALIFTIFIGGGKLTTILPPEYAAILLAVVVLGLGGFILYKLGRRISTILELVQAFVARGHWYLLPLLIVLLSIGSLLVVAASSPFIAPFIYTLF